MRYHLAAAAFAAVLTISTAACAGAPSTVSPDRSPPGRTTSAADSNSATCEGVYAFAMAKADQNDTSVAAFYDLLTDAAKYPPDRQISIRYAFYTKQEKAVQTLVARAADSQLRAALQTYADGWTERAAIRTAAGPDTIQPDWQPIMDLCPGIQHRISTDLTALGE